jgi:alanyl-tRNA synthetase
MISAVIDDVDPGQLRQLANRVTREANVVALLATATESGSHLILARAADAPGAMQHLIKPALETLDSSAGGGAPAIAQGRTSVTDRRRLQEALATAERLLIEQAP